MPALLVSPFARKQAVSHRQYDHTSVLRMIESTFGLSPLTVRDATANDLAGELDFTHARAAPAPIALPHVHYGVPCLATGPLSRVAGLSQLAEKYGFPRP